MVSLSALTVSKCGKKKHIIAMVVRPLSLQTNKQDTVDDWMNTTVKSKDSAATRTLFLERDVSAFLMNVSRRCEHLKCSSVHLQCTEVRAEICTHQTMSNESTAPWVA